MKKKLTINRLHVLAPCILALTFSISSSGAQSLGEEANLDLQDTHESYRAIVEESLVEAARRANVKVKANSSFLLTSEVLLVGGMLLEPPKRYYAGQLREGVDEMIIWFSAKDSKIAPPPGYYLLRRSVSSRGEILTEMVALELSGYSFKLPTKINTLSEGDSCGGSHVEPGEGFVCLHSCSCEFYGPFHPDFGSFPSCFTISNCFPL